MKRIVLMFLLMVSLAVQAQTGRIVGRVVEQGSGKPLKGANVFCPALNIGVVSDAEGHFHFSHLPAGVHTLRASFIGFSPVSQIVTVGSEESVLHFELSSSPLPVADVTVTTLRYATTLRETAVPLAVVTREQLETSAPVTVADVLQREPGLALQRDGIWGTSISIRGLGRNSLVTLVDGNRIDTATDIAAGLAMFDLNDIERIEVIKGAASALYGSGAIGGVVNVISKNGWYQENPYWHMRLLGGYGSVNNSGRGNLSLNAGGHSWYARISGSLRKADNTETPRGELTNSQFQDNALSARLAVKPRPNHELKVNAQRFYARDVGIPGAAPVFPSAAAVRYPFEKRQLISAEYSISALSRFVQQISVRGYKQKIWRDVENIPHTVTSMPASGSQPARKVYALRILPGATHDLNGVQIQGDIFPGQHHLLIAGIDGWQKEYAGYRTKETRIDFLKADGTVSKSVQRTIGEAPLPNGTFRSIGIYAQDEWRLLQERLVVNLGGRMDQIRTKNQETLNPLYEIVNGVHNSTPAGQVVLWPAASATTNSWSGTASLLYRPIPQMDLTLNLSRSFRAPSLEERYQYIDLGSLVKVGDPALDPEKGDFADIGLRIWSDRLQLRLNGFYNRIRDLVVDMPGTWEGRKALLKTNVGKADLYGGDVRLDVKPARESAVWARLAYVHGEDLLLHAPLPQIAPLNGEIGYHHGSLGWISIDLSAEMFATQQRIASGELRTPGYTIFNGYLNSRAFMVAGSKMFVTLGVENLTDRAYRNHLSTNRGLLAIEPGRNYLLTWRVER